MTLTYNTITATRYGFGGCRRVSVIEPLRGITWWMTLTYNTITATR